METGPGEYPFVRSGCRDRRDEYGALDESGYPPTLESRLVSELQMNGETDMSNLHRRGTAMTRSGYGRSVQVLVMGPWVLALESGAD